jgi:hypothetical protein
MEPLFRQNIERKYFFNWMGESWENFKELLNFPTEDISLIFCNVQNYVPFFRTF